MREFTAYSGWDIARPTDESRYTDPERIGGPSQVAVAVFAPSKAAAARSLDVTISHFNTYFSETGNDETIAALGAHEPLTVLVSPMLPQNTINGNPYGTWAKRVGS